MNKITLRKNPIALVDADVLVYKAACVCEKKSKVLDSSGNMSRYDETFYYSIEFAYKILNGLIDKIRRILNPRSIKFILTNPDKKNNYRYSIETKDKKYKQNRVERPYYYEHLRSYFINNYNIRCGFQEKDLLYIVEDQTFVTKINEADDYISQIIYQDYMRCIEDEDEDEAVCAYISCSNDKDFKQNPGFYLDINKWTTSFSDLFGYISYDISKGFDGRGFLFFCAQMLMGDVADNIGGVKGIGPKKTYNILNGCETYQEAWWFVCNTYKEKDMCEQEIKTNATLLWLTKEPGRYLPHSPSIIDMV